MMMIIRLEDDECGRGCTFGPAEESSEYWYFYIEPRRSCYVCINTDIYLDDGSIESDIAGIYFLIKSN